jgi:hypothetical protein
MNNIENMGNSLQKEISALLEFPIDRNEYKVTELRDYYIKLEHIINYINQSIVNIFNSLKTALVETIQLQYKGYGIKAEDIVNSVITNPEIFIEVDNDNDNLKLINIKLNNNIEKVLEPFLTLLHNKYEYIKTQIHQIEASKEYLTLLKGIRRRQNSYNTEGDNVPVGNGQFEPVKQSEQVHRNSRSSSFGLPPPNTPHNNTIETYTITGGDPSNINNNSYNETPFIHRKLHMYTQVPPNEPRSLPSTFKVGNVYTQLKIYLNDESQKIQNEITPLLGKEDSITPIQILPALRTYIVYIIELYNTIIDTLMEKNRAIFKILVPYAKMLRILVTIKKNELYEQILERKALLHNFRDKQIHINGNPNSPRKRLKIQPPVFEPIEVTSTNKHVTFNNNTRKNGPRHSIPYYGPIKPVVPKNRHSQKTLNTSRKLYPHKLNPIKEINHEQNNEPNNEPNTSEPPSIPWWRRIFTRKKVAPPSKNSTKHIISESFGTSPKPRKWYQRLNPFSRRKGGKRTLTYKVHSR